MERHFDVREHRVDDMERHFDVREHRVDDMEHHFDSREHQIGQYYAPLSSEYKKSSFWRETAFMDTSSLFLKYSIYNLCLKNDTKI
jgi:hypothetical protein